MHKYCAKHFLSLFLQIFKITGFRINHILQTCAMRVTVVTLSNNTQYAIVVPGKNLCVALVSYWLSCQFSILIPLENCGLTTFLVPTNTPDPDITIVLSTPYPLR